MSSIVCEITWCGRWLGGVCGTIIQYKTAQFCGKLSNMTNIRVIKYPIFEISRLNKIAKNTLYLKEVGYIKLPKYPIFERRST